MFSRGFSLTEILVVVAIIGLIAPAAQGSLSNSFGRKLDPAANEVASALRLAGSEAIRAGTVRNVSACTTSQRARCPDRLQVILIVRDMRRHAENERMLRVDRR